MEAPPEAWIALPKATLVPSPTGVGCLPFYIYPPFHGLALGDSRVTRTQSLPSQTLGGGNSDGSQVFWVLWINSANTQ